MLYETAYQAMEAPLMLLAGMVMAAAGLIFHAIRRAMCAKFWLSLICDMVTGAVWGGIFLAALTTANRGSLRLYHILLTAAGAMLFHWAVSVPLTLLCHRGATCAGRIYQKVCQNRLVRLLLK